MGKKIAVIGGGASGLTATKCCLDEGLDPVCFERSSDIGGLWNYTEEVREDQACVMRSTIINTSKEAMCFSDFPIPDHFPNFMHNAKVKKYFELYADAFSLKKHIRFQVEICNIKPAEDFDLSGQWIIKSRDISSGAEASEIFDGVMICTGHHAIKTMPEFEGMGEYQGQIIHSQCYKHNEGLNGKKVVVVGFGNSGADILMDCSQACDTAFLSTRRGAWIVNRIGPDGLPADVSLLRRFPQYILNLLPRNTKNNLVEGLLDKNFKHLLFGLKPKHRFDECHPTTCHDLAMAISSGSVVVKPDIKKFTKSGVEFVDGTIENDIDLVICATGYRICFPFIKHPSLEVKENEVNFYKYVFPPDIVPSTLAVIGCVQPLGATIPIAEMQSRWAARILNGCQTLPSKELMWKDIREKKRMLAERYVKSSRHTIQVDWIDYMDQIAKLIGCKPNFWSLLRMDSKLAFHYLFQMCTPIQYRLVGPGKWEGAREALLSTMQRVLKPINQKGIPPEARKKHSKFRLIPIVIVAGVLLKLFIF